MFSEIRKESKHHESAVSINANKFSPNYMILQYLFLNATPKYFMFPNLLKFQSMHQLGHDILRCDIPIVPLQYTARAEMWPKKTKQVQSTTVLLKM